MEEKPNQRGLLMKFPSKVLLAGGYGVLEHKNCGLVLALRNYFYAYYLVEKSQQTFVEVRSPQIDSRWSYRITPKVEQVGGDSDNRFVRCSIQQTLRHLGSESFKNKKVIIYLLFDHGFLSSSCKCAQSEQISIKFPNYRKDNLVKTGLGSSACVVVSVVSMLCLVSHAFSPPLVNVLSHISNLEAQQKIGSNFDISSAVFGSHLYVNLIPKKAEEYLTTGNKSVFEDSFDKPQSIKNVEKLYVYMIDLKKGSDTRKMVGSFMRQLQSLPIQTSEEFFSTSKSIVQHLFENFGEASKMKSINVAHRLLQNKYSNLTGVPIEPDDLKELIDQFAGKPDILYAVCPGSGGYDSICILTARPIELKDSVRFQLSEGGMTIADQYEVVEIEKYMEIYKNKDYELNVFK